MVSDYWAAEEMAVMREQILNGSRTVEDFMENLKDILAVAQYQLDFQIWGLIIFILRYVEILTYHAGMGEVRAACVLVVALPYLAGVPRAEGHDHIWQGSLVLKGMIIFGRCSSC